METKYTWGDHSVLDSVQCCSCFVSLIIQIQTPTHPGVPLNNLLIPKLHAQWRLSWDFIPQPKPNLNCPFIHTALLSYAFFSPTSWFLLPSPSLSRFCPCSLLSDLLTSLPTLPQEQYGFLHADSDCFWLPSLSKISLQLLQRQCFVSRMGVLSTSMGIRKPGSVFSEFQLRGQQSLLLLKSLPLEGQGWSRRIVSGNRRWPVPALDGMPRFCSESG